MAFQHNNDAVVLNAVLFEGKICVMNKVLYKKCLFKNEMKTVLDLVLLASSGKSLQILPPAKTAQLCPIFKFFRELSTLNLHTLFFI